MLSTTGGNSPRFPVIRMVVHPSIWMNHSVISVSEVLTLKLPCAQVHRVYENGVCRTRSRKDRKVLGARKYRIGTNFFLVHLEKISTPVVGFTNQGEKTSFLFQTVRLETAGLFESRRLLSQK